MIRTLLLLLAAAHAQPAPSPVGPTPVAPSPVGPSPVAPSPVGRWETVNRSDNTPAGIVRLFLYNGALYGQIEQIYDPARQHLRCTGCTDDRRDQPFLGLQFLRNLHPDGIDWTGGTVLDPDSGRTYRATLHLADPRHLVIRGYLGISLFGGTQTWTRVD